MLNRKYRGADIVHEISHYLEEVLDLTYFNQLKASLTEGDYFTVIEKLRTEYLDPGTIVIEKRKKNDYFYIILSGEVEIYDEIDSENVEEETERKYEKINTLYEGATFG